MPARDGTGPLGQGPLTGRGMGVGAGLGRGRSGNVRRGAGGSDECECPKCGHTEVHQRGIPCTEIKCPTCGTSMKGKFCK